jgi:alpha-L-fucosidase
MNDSWGFQKDDNNYKTPYEIITIFADAISMGGNLLLDIAPKQDGSIPREQISILEELGKWTNKHSEQFLELWVECLKDISMAHQPYQKIQQTFSFLFQPGQWRNLG